MLKHNKKRNVGLVSEFLSRHIASCIVENKNKDVDAAKNLWVRYLGSDTELAKEHALFNALSKTNVKNKEVAASLIESVRKHCQKQDAQKLNKEKTLFLQEIKTSLKDESFFSRGVSDYRICATIQILMNSWRDDNHNNLSETSNLEDQVMEHLIKENKFAPLDPSVLSMNEKDIDNLVVKIMTEKFDKKYSKVLTEVQRNIVNLYVLDSSEPGTHKKLVDTLKEVRISTLSFIEYEVQNSQDKNLVAKLKNIKGLLEGRYREIVDMSDDLITFYMTVSKLREELNSHEIA